MPMTIDEYCQYQADFICANITNLPVPHTVFTGIASVTLPNFLKALMEANQFIFQNQAFENIYNAAGEIIGVKQVTLYEDQGILETAILFLMLIKSQLAHNNIFRFLLAANLVAIKYEDDLSIKNKEYARLVGLPLPDINSLERNLLRAINFNFYRTPAENLQLLKWEEMKTGTQNVSLSPLIEELEIPGPEQLERYKSFMEVFRTLTGVTQKYYKGTHFGFFSSMDRMNKQASAMQIARKRPADSQQPSEEITPRLQFIG